MSALLQIVPSANFDLFDALTEPIVDAVLQQDRPAIPAPGALSAMITRTSLPIRAGLRRTD